MRRALKSQVKMHYIYNASAESIRTLYEIYEANVAIIIKKCMTSMTRVLTSHVNMHEICKANAEVTRTSA